MAFEAGRTHIGWLGAAGVFPHPCAMAPIATLAPGHDPSAEWIVRGDHRALTETTAAAVRDGLLPAQRIGLHQAWSALAAGDLRYADLLLPENLTALNDHDWSLAAEGALIRGLAAYARGDLHRAHTYAGLAHAGLAAEARTVLLHPTLLLQASLAMHHFDVDGVIATRQQIADTHSPWSHAIHALAELAVGRYDTALDHAALAHDTARRAGVAAHLYPHVAGIVAAWIHRERDDIDEYHSALETTLTALEHFPHLPLLLEAHTLDVHGEVDLSGTALPESLAALSQLGTHPLAVAVFQDLVDAREAHLRIRINDLTRSRVLIDRITPSATRTFLEASLDAEHRPSRSLTQSASGVHRWFSQQIEVEMIRARARQKEPDEAAVHIWRAVETASSAGAIRPLLDNPMAARHFSHPDLRERLDRVRGDSPHQALAHAHLERVIAVHRRHALTGPASHALTARELEVLRAVAEAGDFATVAKIMVLSRWTVRGHFYAACRKLGVSGREAAVARLRQIDRPRPTPHRLDVDQL